MFTVHLDESYGPAKAYSVADYVATVEQWGEFEREWLELAREEGVEYIHKRELEHCRGQFKKWRALTDAGAFSRLKLVGTWDRGLPVGQHSRPPTKILNN